MNNGIVEKPPSRALDGFDDWGGEDHDGRAEQGSLVKFTNEAEWIANDEVLPPTLELVAVNIDRYVVFWSPDGSGPNREKSYYLKPGQKFPDIDQLNADTPKDQWRDAFGKLQGPWQAQHIVRLLHPVSMDRYSFPTSTNGGHAAVVELRQRTRDMRQVRGERVFAVVRFVTFGDDGAVNSSVLVASDAPSLAGPTASGGMKTVETPSAKEAVKDEIVF